MNLLIPFLAAIAVMLALAWAFSRMKTQNAALLLRVGLGVAGVVGGILLTVRGLAVAGIPVLAAGLGLLGVAARGGQGGKRRRRLEADAEVLVPVQASASRRRAAPGPVR
jgi:predicted anti-sigma-YlaC factor YlaD